MLVIYKSQEDNFGSNWTSGNSNIPWLSISDFNCVLRCAEKKGGAVPRTYVINEFSDWLDDNGLL